MNWRKKFEGPKPGDRIKVIKDYNSYKKGQKYTLRHCYIKDGVWMDYNEGSAGAGCKNYWDTEEYPHHGMTEDCFEVL